jgi:hypothetical protein
LEAARVIFGGRASGCDIAAVSLFELGVQGPALSCLADCPNALLATAEADALDVRNNEHRGRDQGRRPGRKAEVEEDGCRCHVGVSCVIGG